MYQDFERINQSILKDELVHNPVLQQTFAYVRQRNCTLHLMGLVSEGGVHSHIRHLEYLLGAAQKHSLSKVSVHAFTDGRDTGVHDGQKVISRISAMTQQMGYLLASVVGRYYAMDRDKRWERVRLAYEALTRGKGRKCPCLVQGVQEEYAAGRTDEFILPLVAEESTALASPTIQAGDAVICFNFRTDRCRQITQVLTQEKIEDLSPLPLHYVTMTRYNESFKNVSVLFEKANLVNTLGEVLEQNNKRQLRAAETEKYPHVTFFFNGGREQPFRGEDRILVPSPKVATYDLQPEMSATTLKDKIVAALHDHAYHFICVNFANTDMVGHSGVFRAAARSAEVVSACVEEIVQLATAKQYATLICADHGNSDYMINEDGTPNTFHSKNPVPLFLVNNQQGYTHLNEGKLGDLAPTILTLMGLGIAPQMDGDILVKK